MALTSRAFADLITFTRASSGTYFDSAGVMQTATTDVPRFNYEYNGSAWVPAGLRIEPAATNLLLRATAFDHSAWATGVTSSVTPNSTTAPNGTTTADTVVSGVGVALRQNVSVSNGTVYTFSAWVKASSSGGAANIRLSINNTVSWTGAASTKVALTSNWQRVQVTWTANGTAAYLMIGRTDATGSGDATCDGNIDVWGAQFETGSVATSFIETTTATATRAADVALISGTNFSSWFNPTEWTAVIQFNPRGACPASTTQRLLSVGDGTSNNKVLLYRSNATTSLQIRSGGSSVAQLDGAVLAVGASHKIAISVKQNNFRMVANGGTVLSDTSGAMPSSANQMGIGYDATAASDIANSEIARVTIYPSGSYSDAALQGLST